MKKFFFSIVALAAIATGCSMSEVENNPGATTPISFDTYFGKAATKAAAYEQANLREDGFTVYAYDHAADAVANYSSAWETFELKYRTSWDYEGDRVYWPSNGNQVDFFPTPKGATLEEGQTEFAFTVEESPAAQVDLVAALASLNQSASVTNSAVKFEFKHLLSRVAFYLQITGSDPVTVSSVKLYGDFASAGNVDLKAETLEIVPTTDKTAEPVTFDNAEESTQLAAYSLLTEEVEMTESAYISTEYMMLIPAEVKGIAITYAIGNNESTKVARAFEAYELEASKAYKFTFVVSSDAISFEVADNFSWGEEINGWGESIKL